MNPESEILFRHHHSAHCESGVTSSLLEHAGVPVSEPMAFGIGSGIFFIYIPFVKVMGLPLTSYRSFPGTIFKKTCRRLQIPYTYQTFRDPVKGTHALDEHLARRQAVGIRGNIFWLPYIPRHFRFQFNAHSLVVYGKDSEGSYHVSDPVVEDVARCPARAMTKARFAKGALAPRGLMYFARPPALPAALPLEKAVYAGIQEVVRRMLFTPLPFCGIRGIRFLSRQMAQWPTRFPDLDTRKLYLANVVRMQEEIGTGGAGFRFLYAAFLQEAGVKLKQPVLREAAKEMTEVGNLWREFATLAAKFCKDRLDVPFAEIPALLLKIADAEKAVYEDLRRRYL